MFQQAKANNNYMKNLDKHKDPLYIMSPFKNNMYVEAMSEKLSIDGFKWNEISEFTGKFITNYKSGKITRFCEVDVECSEKLNSVHNDLLFIPSNNKIGMQENLISDSIGREVLAVRI